MIVERFIGTGYLTTSPVIAAGLVLESISNVDWVGFEPTTTYVSSAVARHARQVFYRTKLPAHKVKPES
jgi:hypothetical protein